MIFLTLGTQLPFDRLARALDAVAADLDEPVFGQIGTTSYVPQNFEHVDFLDPSGFGTRFEAARVIVGHAGIGTILSGQKAGKPLVLMARRADQGEHRNDHQTQTVAQVRRFEGVHIIETEDDLRQCLTQPNLAAMRTDASQSLMAFRAALRDELAQV